MRWTHYRVYVFHEALGSEYAAYIQFCGAPQHDLYHAGQIVLLKQALSASREAA